MNCKDCEGHGWDEDTRGNMIVCKRCAGTGITLHPGDLAALAAANGYVKLADDEMVVKRLKGGEISFGTANIDDVARHFGYVKLEPGHVVVDTKVWLPYLVKAINAAKILQNHGAFTVKHYHGDWPSLEMLEGLKRAIDGQIKGQIMGQYERKPVTTKRGESDWTACRYPDGNPNHYPMGFGETEQQALDDLEEVEGQFDRVCRMNGYRRVER